MAALDPAHSQVVMAERLSDPQGSGRDTVLFITDAAGQHPRWVAEVPGDVQDASVSPDGRWLLYVTQEDRATGDGGIVRTVWVAPIAPAGQDGELDIETEGAIDLQTLSWSGIEMGERLNASWLPGTGDESPRVIVNQGEARLETLTVYNVATLDGAGIWQGPPEGGHEGDQAGFSHDGNYVASRRQQGQQASLQVVGTGGGALYESDTPLPAFMDQIVGVQFAPKDDYVVASVRSRDGIDRGTTQSVYAAGVGDRHRLGPAKRVAIANLPYDPNLPAVALPAQGTLVAYVSAGKQLRATALDGSGDSLVAAEADAVWSLGEQGDLGWWR